jgi:hypothetical protein
MHALELSAMLAQQRATQCASAPGSRGMLHERCAANMVGLVQRTLTS